MNRTGGKGWRCSVVVVADVVLDLYVLSFIDRVYGDYGRRVTTWWSRTVVRCWVFFGVE